MKPRVSTTRCLASGLASSLSLFVAVAQAAPPAITLPPETAVLRDSPLPGHAIAAQKCGICHSADYVDYQPPNMTLTQWTGEMTKMQKAYGAPISDDEIKLLGVYLAATYGDAKTVSDADRALTAASLAPGAPAVAGGGVATAEVQALLSANGCLACHALDHQVVGPGYHDVAVKYRSDPQALDRLAASIRQGGAGKWGTVPMPPFDGLGAGDAKALAAYVLRQ